MHGRRFFSAPAHRFLPAFRLPARALTALPSKSMRNASLAGMHIPAPLEFGSATATRAREILTLTKMNWKSSDGIARLPITLLFARRVGELMAELSDNATPTSSYRFYI
jgi:hypothetical protein